MQELLSLVIKVSDNTIEYSICKGTKIIQIKSNRPKNHLKNCNILPSLSKILITNKLQFNILHRQYQQFDTIKKLQKKIKTLFHSKIFTIFAVAFVGILKR